MKNIAAAIGVASLVLLVVAGAGRAPQVASPAPLPPAVALAEAPREEKQEGFPEPDVLRPTEDDLGLTGEEARDFRSTVLSAVEDVNRAWAIREEGWHAVSSSAASDPELLARLEGEIQSRYESEKERALQRVAAHLGGDERRERLRERLEEWFDALR
jgi:hypothetical protein